MLVLGTPRENSAGARYSQGKREVLALSSRSQGIWDHYPIPGPLSSGLGEKNNGQSNLSLPFQAWEVRTRINVHVGEKTRSWLPASFFLFPLSISTWGRMTTAGANQYEVKGGGAQAPPKTGSEII